MRYKFEVVTPVVTSRETLDRALRSRSQWVIIEWANLLTLERIVAELKRRGKKVLIKIGEIEGLRDDADITMTYLAGNLKVEGIVSNKTRVLMKGRKAGLLTVYTAFILDTQSFITSMKNIKNIGPDIVEVRPGIMPKVVSEMKRKAKIPVWATGLITESGEVEELVRAGAETVVTSKEYLWV